MNTNKRYLLAGAFLAIGVFTLFVSTHGVAQQQGSPKVQKALVPQVGRLVGFAETIPVRDFPNQTSLANDKAGLPPEIRYEGHEINPLNTRGRAAVPGPPERDGALQTSKTPRAPLAIAALPPVGITFEGIDAADEGNSVAPPDTNGDVGPRNYVMTVNNRVRVYDKAGNPLTGFFKQTQLFGFVGGVCGTIDDGDPIVLYDRIADRWLISQFGFIDQTVPPYHECIAISKTSDPTGPYYTYDFSLPGGEFPDYPHFGVWPDGYYMTSNQFFEGGGFDGAGMFAFERAKMLVGDPTAGVIYFNLDLNTHPEGVFGMLPSDHDGINLPPAGAPNVFSYFTDTNFGDPADGLRLFNFHADFATPANSTFTERAESTYAAPLALAPFDARDPNVGVQGRNDIEQPPPTVAGDRLDSIGSRLMFRLQYINRGGTESLVGNFTVNASGVTPNSAANFQAAFRYFELRKTTPGGLYSVNEQATFSPDAGNGATGTNRWNGSAAMDNQGNLAVGYSASSTTVQPSLRYAARAFNDPPNGLFQGEGTLFAGLGSQQATNGRWGDYASLSLDPSDDCTFWFASEYYPAGVTQFNWHTRVGTFKFPTCVAPPQGTLSGTITACDSGAGISEALIQVSNGFSTTSIGNGTYSVQLAPGNYTVNISDPNRHCNAVGPIPVTITNGQTTTLNQCLTGIANPTVDQFDPSVKQITGGNGNGVIDANECNNLFLTAHNFGCAPARQVAAFLSTSTPGVTITQPISGYPDIPIDGNGTNLQAFQVSTSPSFVCGTPVDFTLFMTFNGGTTTSHFSLPTCLLPPATVMGSLAAGDGVQTGRLGRDAVAASCALVKSCPGPLTATPHLYDTYNFVNGPSPACATISTTAGCPAATNPILTKAYLGSYDPTDFCVNYLGDPGGSPAQTNSFEVNVPANGTLVVVVEESGNGGFGCSGYSVTVSGLVGNTSGSGPCVTPTPKPATPTPTATPIPTVTPSPTATGPSEVIGKGTIPAAHNAKASFNVDVSVPPKSKHTVSYSDPSNGFSFNTTNVTSASISGNTAHITGTGKLPNGPTVNFTMDLTDGPDALSISASNGYSNSGNVTGTVVIH